VNPATLGAAGTLTVNKTGDGAQVAGGDDWAGEHWVEAVACDRADRTSSTQRLRFRVKGAFQTARYKLDEGDADGDGLLDAPALSVVDAPNNEVTFEDFPEFTLTPGANFSLQRPGDSFLTFDGVSGQASASRAVAATQGAFSVSAWVRTGQVDRRQVVVSQRGAGGLTFSLAIEPDTACGCARPTFTVADGSITHTVTLRTVELAPHHWYVLAGSFDDLYDDLSMRRVRVWAGDDATITPNESAEMALSGFRPGASTEAMLGHELDAGGAGASHWQGDIEDVRFYSDEINDVDLRTHLQADTGQPTD